VWKNGYVQADPLEDAITEISPVVFSLIALYLEENIPILLYIVEHCLCAQM
jgi:hypothetical protein